MALHLTEKDRVWLKELLAAAEPYQPDAPELCVFDGAQPEEFDARRQATMARRFLEQDGREHQRENAEPR